MLIKCLGLYFDFLTIGGAELRQFQCQERHAFHSSGAIRIDDAAHHARSPLGHYHSIHGQRLIQHRAEGIAGLIAFARQCFIQPDRDHRTGGHRHRPRNARCRLTLFHPGRRDGNRRRRRSRLHSRSGSRFLGNRRLVRYRRIGGRQRLGDGGGSEGILRYCGALRLRSGIRVTHGFRLTHSFWSRCFRRSNGRNRRGGGHRFRRFSHREIRDAAGKNGSQYKCHDGFHITPPM